MSKTIDMTPTWVEAVSLWMFAIANCDKDKRSKIIADAKKEFTRLAQSYQDAVEKVRTQNDALELQNDVIKGLNVEVVNLKIDLANARYDYKGIRDHLDDLPVHESPQYFEYVDQDDVIQTIRAMNERINEWGGNGILDEKLQEAWKL